MSNIYGMGANKKVVMTDKPPEDGNITYKEIMRTVIEHATEEGCHHIFCYGGINMCPSDILGTEKIDKEMEEDACENRKIECTKCWMEAIKQMKGYKECE